MNIGDIVRIDQGNIEEVALTGTVTEITKDLARVEGPHFRGYVLQRHLTVIGHEE